MGRPRTTGNAPNYRFILRLAEQALARGLALPQARVIAGWIRCSETWVHHLLSNLRRLGKLVTERRRVGLWITHQRGEKAGHKIWFQTNRLFVVRVSWDGGPP